ncbi:MAG: von Willebrand factor type A domain-containing protein [Deltaproteobacteria bacterium]|nr:von Willebrand factor type A domain-containing protein [Deltaproteobacteria bacterium]
MGACSMAEKSVRPTAAPQSAGTARQESEPGGADLDGDGNSGNFSYQTSNETVGGTPSAKPAEQPASPVEEKPEPPNYASRPTQPSGELELDADEPADEGDEATGYFDELQPVTTETKPKSQSPARDPKPDPAKELSAEDKKLAELHAAADRRGPPKNTEATKSPDKLRELGQKLPSATPVPDDVPLEVKVLRDPRARDMIFQSYGVNPTIDTSAERFSTFSIDVDTAAYSMARAFLLRGELPAPAAVRVEEFVNSFDYGYESPSDAAFAVDAEVFPSKSRRGYHVLRVGVAGKKVEKNRRKPSNLVFVVDVSGSMNLDNRLGLVKRALQLLVEQLDGRDAVSIVVYGDSAHTVLAPTPGTDKGTILAAIGALRPEGSTNVQAGLELGYKLAAERADRGTNNRIILCSDGVANNGIVEADGIFARVKSQADQGITISTVGFGMGNYNDVLMEKLADSGNGNYAYVDRLEEARRVFVEGLTGTLEVIAKDVKIQVEFDPAVVSRYRLVGYENRALKKKDFEDDKVDAGEIGAGHTVTALYEIKLSGPGDLGTLRVRYKEPDGKTSRLVERPLFRRIVRASPNEALGATRLALVAAGFAEKLRGSYWVRATSYADLLSELSELPPELANRKDVVELKGLIGRARAIDVRKDRFEQYAPIALMSFDDLPVLR